ncbi:chloride channel protein [Algoriphagus sp.]|uniref:chloride channel protein n=1 Tax=Algoriphagus sp. TaxID=1872435 RepID=UPI00262B923B|nr:chloride channel protein [Algoriphagus sp.]
MKIKQKRKLIEYSSILDQPIRFSPFLFGRDFWLWALLGLVGGSIAGVYWVTLESLIHILAGLEGWTVIPLMTFAGLLAGLIIHWIGDPGEIHLIVNNIRFNKGKLNPKNNPSMILSSLICVAAGGSLGPEAPLVQVTGSTGTWLGKLFRLKGEALRTYSIAGMASGFTALFGAPLGGSLFAVEILHHKHMLEYYRAVVPALVASCFSYLVFALIIHLGLGPTWNFPQYSYQGIFDFGYAFGIAILGSLVAWIFIFSTKACKKAFESVPMPIYAKTTLGGLVLGVIGFGFPITRYFGHHEINELIVLNLSWEALLLILGMKILAISVTVTSGWRGGFIIPLFFVGTCLGLLLCELFPSLNPTLTWVSCMAAVNACVTRTPVSTTILLCVLTGFGHFVPILIASLTGYFLAPRIPFIHSQLKNIEA